MKKILIFCILLISIISISAVSATQNITNTPEITDISQNNLIDENITVNVENTDSNSENILESANDEIIHENKSVESKIEPDIRVYNTEFVYGDYFISSDDIMIETPILNTDNLKFYLDDKQITPRTIGGDPDYLRFFYDHKNLTIGTHTLKVEFNGDEKYLPRSVTQTIYRNASIYVPERMGYGFPYCSVTLRLPENAKGNLVLYLDNEKYNQSKITNGFAEIKIANLKPGLYNLTAKYDGDDYPVNDVISKFEVEPIITISGTNCSANININFYKNTTGIITILDTDTNKTLGEASVINSESNISIDDLKFENNLTVIYNSADYNFTAYEKYSWTPCYYGYYRIGPGSYIALELPKNTTGTISVGLWERVADGSGMGAWNNFRILSETSYANGTAKCYMPSLSGGIYIFTIDIDDEYYGHYSNWEFSPSDFRFETFKVIPTITIPNIFNATNEIVFELYQAEGILDVYVDGIKYTTENVKNGKSTINLNHLGYGKHNITLDFYGSKNMDKGFFEALTDNHYRYDSGYWITYKNYYEKYTFTQEIFDYEPVGVKTNDVVLGNPAVINIKAEDNVKNVVVCVLDKNYTLNSPELNITLNDLKAGTHTVNVYYIDENNIPCEFNKTFNVISPKLSGNNINMYYCDGSSYKVKLTVEGKPLADAYVTIAVGKTTKKVKTNANGIATLKITELPKKYTIKASYNGIKTTNTITIKKILTLSTVKVKKSSKNIVLTAKLAKKLKGKTITFKFNGKTYKGKTNSKGVAKVTIPKSQLKKLKIGKKITYQSIYAKETAKKTVKVQK